METQKQRIALWRLLGLAQGVRDALDVGLILDQYAIFKRMVEIVKEYEKENTRHESAKKIPQ